MEKTTVYLPSELQRRLRDLAHQRKQPQAELIRDALDEYLRVSAKPLLRSLGLGADEDLSAVDCEDYLRRRWARG